MLHRKFCSIACVAALIFGILGGCSRLNHIVDENIADDPLIVGQGDADDYPVEIPKIVQNAFELKLEVEEEFELSEDLSVKKTRTGYSGKGYVTGFVKGEKNGKKSSAVCTVEIPSSQHYDITVCVASDANVFNAIAVNGKKTCEFEISGTEQFIRVTFTGVFLEKGDAEFSVFVMDGNFDFDYIEIINNDNIADVRYIAEPKLCNPNAGKEALALMEYLSECYGEYVLTGQYASTRENIELDLIYQITGQYPAIRFGDLRNYSLNQSAETDEIQACINWAERGGIVGLMWYWAAPIGRPSVYAASCDFILSNAVTDEEVSTMSKDSITKLVKSKKLSEECAAIIDDIDAIALQLSVLQEKNIPVLWRPLHEAGGGWYWWGSQGAEAYQWLWKTLYLRLTYYHELNNLIWIWNGQDVAFTVPGDMYDIASLDIYISSDDEMGSRMEQFQRLNELAETNKLLAISECGSVPNIDNMFRDNSVWSFFGLWYGKYIMNASGEFSGEYNTAENLKRVYNSAGSINLYKYVTRFGDEEPFTDEDDEEATVD